MNHSVPATRHPAWQSLTLASAFSLCFCPFSFAQADDSNQPAPVIITASRFTSDPALAPIGASVITAADIRNAGVDNVNQAIRNIGGVYGRSSFYGTQDFDLDLRGFGTNSSQNLVVLVDGVRLSENELTAAQLSSIPIDTVERIEIMRGGGSVLYGDGAISGVIQIITKRPQPNALHGSATAEIGQYRHREIRTSIAKGWDGFALDASLSGLRTDNYRDNNAVRQENFSGGAQWTSAVGRAGLRIDLARQDSRFAGALSLAQFEANPSQTLTPNDYGSIDSERYTAFVERRFGAWEAAAELSRRDKTIHSFFDYGIYGTSASDYESRQTQFSPRLRRLDHLGGMTNELVSGLDFSRWTRATHNSYSQADASQQSKAVYVRDEIKWDRMRLAAGARHEVFDKDAVDPVSYPNINYRTSQALNAWELQAGYAAAPQLDLFVKTGQSYRVANADENGYTALANTPLHPQLSHDLELGGSYGNAARKLTVRLFRHRLHDEIFYDPTANGGYGANTNLDPTERKGLEVEASVRVADGVRLSGQWQHVNARFIEGVNAGKEMVMVPDNTVSARLSWLPADGQSANLGVQWVSEQRYGGDFANTCPALIPAHATLDGRYARRIGTWELAIAGSNLTDKHYFSNAYGCQSGIYPSDGRQLKITARHDF